MRFETLTEGWSDTSAVVYHVHDSFVSPDWDGEPLGILFSSEDETEVRHMVDQLNLNVIAQNIGQ